MEKVSSLFSYLLPVGAVDHPADHIDFVVKGLVHSGVKSPTRGKSLVFISNFQEFLMKCCEVVICPLCQAS